MMDSTNEVEVLEFWLRSEAPFQGRSDKAFITKFLNCCAYDIEKTKEKITNYYHLRKEYPGLMTNRDFQDEKVLKVLNRGFLMSDFDQERQCPVVNALSFSKLRRKDDIITSLRLIVISQETALMDPIRAQKYGSICIINMGDIPLSRLLQFTPDVIDKLVKCLLIGLPVKVHQIHIINVNALFMVTVNVLRLFMPPELKSNLYVHKGSWESLEGYVPPECLPVEYGGTSGTLEENSEKFQEELLKWRSYLLDDEIYGF